MLNIFEVLRADFPGVRKFEIGDLLFAHVTCPPHDSWELQWAQHDHLVHVLTGDKKAVRTPTATWSAGPGDTVFIKKGAYLLEPHMNTGSCLLMFFIPDVFVRETVRAVAAELPPLAERPGMHESVLPVTNDAAFEGFFQSILLLFAANEPPPELLLKLKLRELITSILVSPKNRGLSAYLRTLARQEGPALPAIMEANCCHNLPLEAFAKMCHRSLSSFKRDFRKHYRSSPRKWLIERRLECAAHLLQTTSLSVTEIVFDCGFQDASHFTRVFGKKYGQPPTAFRAASTALV